MLKSILIATVLIFTQTSMAQNNQQLINEIMELARVVRDEARVSNASEQNLISVRNNLEDSIALLRSNNGGGPNLECFDFAYQKYFTSNTSSNATDKATKLCRGVTDVPVLKFAFEKYFTSNTNEGAIDKAGAAASKPMRNKLDMLTFAFGKYFVSNTSEASMNKAANGIALVRSGSLDCLKTFFDRHFSSNTSEVAMNKAIESCQ